MAYFLDLNETTVSPYLDALELSPDGERGLSRALDTLADFGDQFRTNPTLRLSPKSDCFWFLWYFLDRPRGTINSLHFVVCDTPAQYGVLKIEYVELVSEPLSLPS